MIRCGEWNCILRKTTYSTKKITINIIYWKTAAFLLCHIQLKDSSISSLSVDSNDGEQKNQMHADIKKNMADAVKLPELTDSSSSDDESDSNEMHELTSSSYDEFDRLHHLNVLVV